MNDINTTIKRLEQLADDYEKMANEIKRKRNDCNALVMLDGVVIGMRRCINELKPVKMPAPLDNMVDSSMGDLRDAIKKARGGNAPPQQKGFA